MSFYSGMRKTFEGFIRFLFRVHVYGAENEPEGNYLACSNHISLGDVLVTSVAVRQQICFMAKKELFKIPLLRKLITALGAFPVDRTGNAVGAMKKAISMLGEGKVVGMFPQGHRYRGVDPKTTKDKIKGGAGMAVYRSGCDVLPFYVESKNYRVKWFRRVNVYIGKPISFEEFSFTDGGSGEYQKASELIFDRILALEEQAPELRRAAGEKVDG